MVKEPRDSERVGERIKSVGLGAIVVIGAESEGFCPAALQGAGSLVSQPVACTDILGRSMVERAIERFARADVEAVTVLVAAENRMFGIPVAPGLDHVDVTVRRVPDIVSAITQTLNEYSDRGIAHSFVASANLYAETDLLDLFYFHREARQAATRCLKGESPLDLWVVHCEKALQTDVERLLTGPERSGASYMTRDYVISLNHPADLRRLVSDALSGRCGLRPSGREIKPGVWVDEKADIHRTARIVAPAYIGRGSKVQQDTLITRCSNIERDCCIDCGTVIEDSSILPNTTVGIWLDVCHAVASGNKLLSLGHEVVVEISDPSVLRSTAEMKNIWELKPALYAEREIDAGIQQKQPSAPETWQLGANLIQG
jgi:NDP-sugar pyrophosphorylase family protein